VTTATKALRLWEEWQQMQLKATREVFLDAGQYLPSILTFRMHKGEPRTEMFQTDGSFEGDGIAKLVDLACERAKAEGYCVLIEAWTSFDIQRAGRVHTDPARGEALFATFNHRYLPGKNYWALIHRDPLRLDEWRTFLSPDVNVGGRLVGRAGMTGDAT